MFDNYLDELPKAIFFMVIILSFFYECLKFGLYVFTFIIKIK